MTPTLEQRVTVSADTLASELGEEVVLLNLASGVYFGLDETGARMWSALTRGHTIREALEVLFDEYDVDSDTLQRDLITLVERLELKGLVQLTS